MATIKLHQITCIKEATSTDFSTFYAFFNSAFPQLASFFFGLPDTGAMINAVSGLAAAIVNARSDPDNLYVTTATQGNLGNSIWPGSGQVNDIQQYQSVAPNKQIAIPPDQYSMNISLWDYDILPDDDLLGSITVYASDVAYGVVTKTCWSNTEFSCYCITYEVV